jgi:hypothetical protein
MCTVTIVPVAGGIRMAVNRDESPLRAEALPPRIVAIGKRKALMPIDPVSGGTWVAVTDAGLIVTILNAYPTPRNPNAPAPPISRGTIIPRLLDADPLDAAYLRTRDLDAAEYAAFRLVIADATRVADVIGGDGACDTRPPRTIDGPLLFTSSGLGDGVVDPPRRALFNQLFADATDWRERQDAYHRHSWPEARHLSVCMWRPEARTVSLAIAEIDNDEVRMDYWAGAPNSQAPALRARLARRDSVGHDITAPGRASTDS